MEPGTRRVSERNERAFAISKLTLFHSILDAGPLDGLNSIQHYARAAKNAWQLLMLTEEDEITYLKFKKALDFLNVVILEGRAMRIFRNCDLDGSGNINMSEFEVALMMNDAIPKSGIDLTPLDAFYIFDLDQSGEINQVRHETRDTRQ